MNNKLIITEVNRIQELMGKSLIIENWVNIASDALDVIFNKLGKQSGNIERLLNSLGKSTNEAQIRSIITQLVNSSEDIAKILVPKILSSLTPLELKSISDFSEYLAKNIKNGRVKSFEVSGYIDDYLENKLTTNMAPIKNHFKNKLEISAKEAINEFNTLTPGQAFRQGYRSSTGAGLFAKHVARNIPYLGKKYLQSRIYRLTKTELDIVYKWFWFGLGDINQVVSIFKKHGVLPALANLSGQLFKKWWFWTQVITITNALIDIISDISAPEVIDTNDYRAVALRILNNVEFASLSHMFPVKLLLDYIVFPLARGGALYNSKEKVIEMLKTSREKASRKLEKIENFLKVNKPKVEKKVDTITKKIDSTEAGFKAWAGDEYKDFKNDVGYTTNDSTWIWDKDKNTFVKYP